MLKRTIVLLSALVGVAIVVAAVGFGLAARSGAGGQPNAGAGVRPGFVGQTAPAESAPKPAPAGRAAVVSSSALIQRIDANAPANGVERGTARAELHTAGELPYLKGRYASDYAIWVVTVHGNFPIFSAPPGAHVPPLTTEIMYFDAYSGDGIGDVLSTDTFTPRQPGAGVPVTPAVQSGAAQ